MVINNFKEDIENLCAEEATNKAKLAETLGMTRQAVYKKLIRTCVSKSFVEICEALGYDIEVRYIRQKT